MRPCGLGFAALWLLTVTKPAAAIEGPETEAEALFRSGRAAMTAGQVALACEKFRRSFELKETLGTQLNLAICEEELGHPLLAWRLHQTLLLKLAPDDPRHEIVLARIEGLRARLVHVTLYLDARAPEASVATTRDGSQIPFDVSVVLAPGNEQIRVTAPGHQPRLYELRLDPGTARPLTVAPGPALGNSVTGPRGSTSDDRAGGDETMDLAHQSSKLRTTASPEPDHPRTEPPSSRRAWGWVTVGAGSAALLVSAVSAALMLEQDQVVDRECSPSDSGGRACSDAGLAAAERGKMYSAVATAGFAVGVGGIGAGTYLLVSGTPGEAGTGLSPMVSVSGAF